jgi:aminopeptidase N
VPVRASAGGAAVQVVTSGPTAQLTVPGCGPLLLNPGQTGYYRTLYTPAQLQALQGAFQRLGGVDQYGLLSDQMALATTGYQPMAAGLNFVGEVPASANQKVVQLAVGEWSDLYDDFDNDAATQAAIAARVTRIYGPRLQQLGLAPRQGEPATDALLRGTLIGTLGKLRDPAVLAEANRLFAAWQNDPNAIPGSLKQTWLRVVARNANEATWNALHAKAQAASGSVERTSLYQLLGAARDEALARRTLELALTNEPGKTVSAGIITAVAAQHSRMAVDFVLAHLAQVNQLIDISGRSRFMQRLVAGSNDASLIATLQSYANANLAATDRKPIEQAIDRLRFQSSSLPRIRSETSAWLQAHPA